MENRTEQGLLERVFHLKENHADVKAEIIAGVTTFMTMAYILVANPNILGATGVDRGAVLTATALASLIVTLLMAAFANYPFVLAPGMGFNAYFAHTVVLQVGYSWGMALVAIFVEGLTSIVLSLTSVHEATFNAIPMNLRHTVFAGIGLFIAFIGLQNARIVVKGAALASVSSSEGSLETGTLSPIRITVLLALVDVLVTGILVVKNVEGNIPWGILITWLLGIICEVAGLYQPNADLGMFSVLPDFSNGLSIQSMAPIFFKMDLSGIPSFNFIAIMFAFLSVDMFGILGAPISVTSKADMLDKDGKLPEIKGALMANAVNTSLDAVFGISTTITFVESASGVAEGGRIGFASVVTALFFRLSLFLSSISLAIPSFTTAPALIMVGFLMVSFILKTDFNDFTEVIPSYIVIIAIPFMYSIFGGIAMGVIPYIVINLATGHVKGKKVNLLAYVLAVPFVLRYVLIQRCAECGEVLSHISAYSIGARCNRGNFSHTKLEETSQSMVRCFRT